MKFTTTEPIYMQIMNSIKKDIVTGVLVRGGRLDSVRALSEKFEVNLNTMQRACSELERQGVIYTQRGIGSFVTEDENVIAALKKEMSAELIQSFIGGMEGIGYNNDEIFEIIRKVLEK
jgi:GntR family transcriptional regulator